MKKKNEPSFIGKVFVSSLVIFIVSAYPVIVFLNKLQITSLLCGFLVSLLNALIGYRLNNIAMGKQVKIFMVILFGGMGIRILVLAILLLVLLKIAGLDEVSLIGSAFLFYMVFMTLEILYFHTRQIKIETEDSFKKENN